MKIEHEKMNIEKEKVVLETKVKHIGEQSETHACTAEFRMLILISSMIAEQYIEQELQQLKEKANRDEQTRQEVNAQLSLPPSLPPSLSLSLSPPSLPPSLIPLNPSVSRLLSLIYM